MPAVQSEVLQAFEPVLQATAAAILAGPDALEWCYLEARLLPDFEKKGWTLARPVHLLKQGARSLSDVTAGIDEQSATLIERVLQIVTESSDIDGAAGSQEECQRMPASPTLFGNSVQRAIQHDDIAELTELLRIGWPLDAVLDGVHLQAHDDSSVSPDVRFNALSFAVLSRKPGIVSALLSAASVAGGAAATAALIASRPPNRNRTQPMDGSDGQAAWDMRSIRDSIAAGVGGDRVGGGTDRDRDRDRGFGAGSGARRGTRTNCAHAPDALQWALFLTGGGKEAEAIACLLAAAADRNTIERRWLRHTVVHEGGACGSGQSRERERGYLPIEQAIAREWWSVAELLRGRGASVERCETGGAAERAVGQFVASGNTRALSHMRQLGWDLNRALHIFTARRGTNDGSEEELEGHSGGAGGDGNCAYGDPGFNPLHYAVQLRQSTSLKALLALGASPSVLTGAGESALELALQFAMHEKQRRHEAGSIAKSQHDRLLAQQAIPGESIAIALLHAGADCNKMLANGLPPPSRAVELGWFALTRQMISGTATALNTQSCARDQAQGQEQGRRPGCDLTLFDARGWTLATRLVHLADELATEHFDTVCDNGVGDSTSAISGPLAVLREIGARDRAAHSNAVRNGECYVMSIDFAPPVDAEFGAMPPLLHAVHIRTQAWSSLMEAHGSSEACEAQYRAACALAVIKVLLGECCADRDVREPQHSRSALHFAALNGDIELAQLLLEINERGGATVKDESTEVDAYIGTKRIANVNARSTDKLARPLDFALNRVATGHNAFQQANCAEVAILLVRCGSDPNEAIEPGVPGSPSSIAFASDELALKMRKAWKSRLQQQHRSHMLSGDRTCTGAALARGLAPVSAAAPPPAPCSAVDAPDAQRTKHVSGPPPFSAMQTKAAATGKVQQNTGAVPSAMARTSTCVATGKARAAVPLSPAGVHIPDEFKCPISMELMSDPVTCVDGHSYERAAITTWLETNDTSPRTNLPLEAKILIPNHSLKAAIATFVENNPSVLTVQL